METIKKVYWWIKALGMSTLVLVAILSMVDGYTRLPVEIIRVLVFDAKIFFCSGFALLFWGFLDFFLFGALKPPSQELKTLKRIEMLLEEDDEKE